MFKYDLCVRSTVDTLLVNACNECINFVDAVDAIRGYCTSRLKYVSSPRHVGKQIMKYKEQQPPFTGYMFVRYNKIPTCLKPCRISHLRSKLVEYLSDTTSSLRLGGSADDAPIALRLHVRKIFTTVPSTVPDFHGLCARCLD